MRWLLLVPCLTVHACSTLSPQDPFANARWQVAVARVGVSLRGVCVVDRQVAWASGSHGTVVRTVDGGSNWQSVGPSGAVALDFRDVEAFDRERAVVCTTTEPARVYWTADGGATWQLGFEDHRRGAFFDGMAFFAGGRGLLCGDPIDGELQLHVGSDQGERWLPAPASAAWAAVPGEAAFAASGTCIAVVGNEQAWVVTGGVRSRALRTTDGGETWAMAPLPLAAGRPSQGAFGVAFFDADHGIVVGGDYEVQDAVAGTAAVTDDGGCSWRPVEGIGGYRSGVACCDDGRSCIAVGQGGCSVSNDRGATWRPFGEQGFHAVASRDGVVCAVGTAGRVGWLVGGGR